MKKIITICFALVFSFMIASTAEAETILFEDFEDETGFSKAGHATGYWGIAPMEGTSSIPSGYVQGGSQEGGIFYGSFGKDFSNLDVHPTMSIDMPDLSDYSELKITVSLAAPFQNPSVMWEINHRDKLLVDSNLGNIDIFRPTSNASPLVNTEGVDLGYTFQDFQYEISDEVEQVTFTFASTDYPETVGIDSVLITGTPKLTDKEQCMDGGWQQFSEYGFRNQGKCVSYVEKMQNRSSKPEEIDQCQGGGWVDFPNHDFKNQGECISYFVKNEKADEIVFFDDFNDGDADGWWLGYSQEDPGDGNWRVEDIGAPYYGTLVQDEGGDHYSALVEGIQCSNQAIATNVKMNHVAGVGGVTIWFQDDHNWVEIYMYPASGHIRILENINGTRTAYPYGVYPYTSENNIWHKFEVIANSDTGILDVYVDDSYVLTHTVLTTHRYGLSGVNTSNSGAYFDDFTLMSK